MPVGYNYRPDKHKVQIDKCSFVNLSIPVQGQEEHGAGAQGRHGGPVAFGLGGPVLAVGSGQDSRGIGWGNAGLWAL